LGTLYEFSHLFTYLFIYYTAAIKDEQCEEKWVNKAIYLSN